MRFYTDPAAPVVRVRWYFVPAERPDLDLDTVFCSRNEELYDVGWPLLGEVEGATRLWRNGAGVGDAPGTHVCGSAEQWVYGQASPPTLPVPVDVAGTPLCCFPAGASPPSAVQTACCINPIPALLTLETKLGSDPGWNDPQPVTYHVGTGYWSGINSGWGTGPFAIRFKCSAVPAWVVESSNSLGGPWAPPATFAVQCLPFLVTGEQIIAIDPFMFRVRT